MLSAAAAAAAALFVFSEPQCTRRLGGVADAILTPLKNISRLDGLDGRLNRD
jgi:hypothetical protein